MSGGQGPYGNSRQESRPVRERAFKWPMGGGMRPHTPLLLQKVWLGFFVLWQETSNSEEKQTRVLFSSSPRTGQHRSGLVPYRRHCCECQINARLPCQQFRTGGCETRKGCHGPQSAVDSGSGHGLACAIQTNLGTPASAHFTGGLCFSSGSCMYSRCPKGQRGGAISNG